MDPREIVHRLSASLRATAVVLFGSRARDEHTQHSDRDIAVVSPVFTGEPRMYRRVERILDALRGMRRIDAVGLDPRELQDLDCLLVLDIVADGIPLYDDGCFARARQRLAERISAGSVARIAGGWRIQPRA